MAEKCKRCGFNTGPIAKTAIVGEPLHETWNDCLDAARYDGLRAGGQRALLELRDEMCEKCRNGGYTLKGEPSGWWHYYPSGTVFGACFADPRVLRKLAAMQGGS